jgi:hypothetical protein
LEKAVLSFYNEESFTFLSKLFIQSFAKNNLLSKQKNDLDFLKVSLAPINLKKKYFGMLSF